KNKEVITNYLKYLRGIENARKLAGSSGLVAQQALYGGRGGFLKALGESFIKANVSRAVSAAAFSPFGRAVLTKVAQGHCISVALAVQAIAKVVKWAKDKTAL